MMTLYLLSTKKKRWINAAKFAFGLNLGVEPHLMSEYSDVIIHFVYAEMEKHDRLQLERTLRH